MAADDDTFDPPRSTTSKIPRRVGPYRIERLIGEGGMGAVFEGVRDEDDFELRVAIKVIRSGALSDSLIEPLVERFERERQVLAGLNHSGIARLFDGGTLEDGSPYIVMEFIDGAPITQWCDTHALPQAERLRLFQEVCVALRHAHQNLIIHRDITPGNVMVRNDGVVKLIDFGIAKPQSVDELTGKPPKPSLGSLTFTPGYAAPERATGAPPSVLSDIFSLGKLLQAMLIATEIDADLQAIITTASALAPEDRYASVDAFRNDVFAVLEHRPVVARNGGALYQLGKFVRRFPLPSALSVALVAALAGGLLTSIEFAKRAETQARLAEANLSRAEYNLDQAELNSRTSAAYADTLQLMFGGEGDVERLTRMLKERWRESHAMRDEDPESAAYLSYAIGAHFRDRNDYVTAREIHSTWLDAGYGPQMLQNWGKSSLAISYSQLGQSEKALPIMRETQTRYMAGYEAGSSEHIALVSQIALTSNELADLKRAEQMLMEGLATISDSRSRRFFWNQLAFMRMQLEDHEGAHDAVRQAVDISDTNPLNTIAGKDTALVNLATFEYHRASDRSLARALIAKVLEGTTQARGTNREAGLAMTIEARVLAEDGDLDTAVARAAAGADIVERFAGATSRRTKEARLSQAYVLTLAGRYQEARQMIDNLRQQLPTANKAGRSKNSIDLMDVFVRAHAQGVAAARLRAKQLAIDSELIGRDVADTYLMDRLITLGF